VADQDESSRELKLDLDQFRNAGEIPDEVADLIDKFPFIIGGEDTDELQLIQEGMCIICRTAMGEATTLVLDDQGIISIVCSGVCHSDAMVASYLHEQMNDLMDRIRHRHELKEGHGG
jgi:hypothetical protein